MRPLAAGAAAIGAVASLLAVALALWREYDVVRTIAFALIVAGTLLAVAGGGTGAARPEHRHWMHPALTRLIAATALAAAGLFLLLATV